MRRRCRLAIVLGIVLASVALPARAELPSVARARYGTERGLAKGTVFFLETARGPVAVGAAHSFEASKLFATPELAFELGHTHDEIATTTRLLTPLGLGYGAPGGTLRTDFVVFALDVAPSRVRVFAAGIPDDGERVDVFGIPSLVGKDQDVIGGRVQEADDEKLEIRLDTAYDLRGWGGAPVVARESGSVIGIVQAAQPDGRKMRVLATPIGAVQEALRLPLDGGRGRAFAAFAEPGSVAEPAPSPAVKPDKGLVLQAGPLPPLALAIDHPQNETIVGGADATTFLAGRAVAQAGEGLKTDVVFVVDLSYSASWASGVDVNGNGTIGTQKWSEGTGLYGLGSVDAGDSVLAVELAAVRRLSARLDPRYTRIAIASFAGRMLSHGVIEDDPAFTWVGLTNDYDAVDRALDRLLANPRWGPLTFMTAGVDQATRELTGQRGALSTADPTTQKIVIFLTDGIPSLPFIQDDYASNTLSVLGAAKRAAEAGIRVFTFGVGDDALAYPLALVELARTTGGTFTAIRDPAQVSHVFDQTTLSDIEDVTIRNTTLDAAAQGVEVGADGTFGAFVPLRTGRNVIEVTVRASGDRATTEQVTVHFAPDAPAVATPPGLMPLQTKLLELELTRLRRDRIAGEQQRDERVRKELELEIERERTKALDRAAQQRKELKLEIDREGKPGEAP